MSPSRLGPVSFSIAISIALAAAGCASVRMVAPAVRPTLDYEQLRAEAEELRRLDPGGRIRRVRWSEDGGTLSFDRLGEPYVFDLAAHRLARVEPPADEEANDDAVPRRRRRGPGRGQQRARETSPDGKWIAIAHDWNVVVEPVERDDSQADPGADPGAGPNADPGPEAIAVTTDGHRKLRYGKASWVYGEELDQQSAMWWSPDSTRLAYYAFDEREVPDYFLLKGLTGLHTTPVQEGYPKPGQPNPIAALLVYEVATGETTRVATAGDDEEGGPWYVYNVRFTPDGSELLFSVTNRHQNVLHVRAADLDTGAVRTVVTERQATWQKNRPLMRFLADQRHFIWETERSGRRQFELRHLDGSLVNPLTKGDAPAISIVRVDEDAGVVYFTAYDADHPLDVHLHRVRLDGSEARRLTRERGRHSVEIAPDGAWFITRYETIAQPPTTALYDTMGNRIATLAASDPERVEALGYPAPELFRFKADDGVTDLYGWLYKPRGFDPSRRYPLLIDVYGGPGSKGVRNVYRVAHTGASLGFLVAKIDNRGTGGRGKAFLGAAYRQLGTVDLEDQANGVRHLLRRRYVDADRVGIYGHSYGGYMSALAILKHPDVFRVAVAGAPVTDWRNYDTIYTERYMRTPEENAEGYDAGSCLTYAKDLRGKLLIQHGMVDDNVHPNNAWQLIDALQKAGKSFDMMFYPNSAHGLGLNSSEVRWRYLHEHLIAAPARAMSTSRAGDE